MSNLRFMTRRRLLCLLPIAVLAASGASLATLFQPLPVETEFALSRPTERGLYVSTLEPGLSPVPLGRIHAWTVMIATPQGKPVEHATISIDGGMPRHGHGLPTKPRVTAELGGGRYRIEGMKFNMPGWWTITLGVSGPTGTDFATFNLML